MEEVHRGLTGAVRRAWLALLRWRDERHRMRLERDHEKWNRLREGIKPWRWR